MSLEKYKISLPTVCCCAEYPQANDDACRLFILSSLDVSAEMMTPMGTGVHQSFLGVSALLSRRHKVLADLAKTPLLFRDSQGCASVWVYVDPLLSRFNRYVALRQAWSLVLAEETASVVVSQIGSLAGSLLEDAAYVGVINAVGSISWKKEPGFVLKNISIVQADMDSTALLARAYAHIAARCLIDLPPNVLTPQSFREHACQVAAQHGLAVQVRDYDTLYRMGAGAFCAVAQGSQRRDAVIMRLSWSPLGAQQRISFLGKGVCFDSGGYNVKPARGMAGMHRDMAGAAVALSLVEFAAKQQLPVAVDAWLVLSNNAISAEAYVPTEVVTALDGTTIEIVHTDAEGRLLLADTLALANREQQDLMVSFATLTGSMVTALGSRMSGVFASTEPLKKLAEESGLASGERVCVFPMPSDYDELLESQIADVCQCTLDSDADHILAARFLRRFSGDAWIHVDLSAASCKGGLGAVTSETTGFGVAWGIALLSRWMK